MFSCYTASTDTAEESPAHAGRHEIKAALRDPSVVFLSTQQSRVNTHFCPTTCVRWKHSNGVERYSSACSFDDDNIVMQPPPPPASMTATGHTPLLLMACVSVFVCLRPQGSDILSRKMADSGSCVTLPASFGPCCHNRPAGG